MGIPYRFFLTLKSDPSSQPLTTNHTPPNSALTACKHTVSGSLSLPSRGAFHLSLTVLVLYRSPRVFSLGRWSSRIPTGFPVPRGTWDPLKDATSFAYRAVTFCDGLFQTASAKSGRLLAESPATPSTQLKCERPERPTVRTLDGIRSRKLLFILTPRLSSPTSQLSAGFGLAPLRSPLLGGSIFLSLPPATKMFQFAGCPPRTYVFGAR